MKAFVFFRERDSGEGWLNEVGAVIIASDLDSAKKIFLEHADTSLSCYAIEEYQIFEKEIVEGVLAAFDVNGMTDKGQIQKLYPGVRVYRTDDYELEVP